MGCDLSSAQQHNCIQPDLPAWSQSLYTVTSPKLLSVLYSVSHSLTLPYIQWTQKVKVLKSLNIKHLL